MARGVSKKPKAKAKTASRPPAAKADKGLGKVRDQALKLAGQPVVSETVAAALLAAAAALRNPPAAKRAVDTGQEALRIGETLRAVAIRAAREMLDAWEAADSRPRKRGG